MIRQLVDGSAIQPRELMPLPFNSPRSTEILAYIYICCICTDYETFSYREKTDLEYTLFLLQKEDSILVIFLQLLHKIRFKTITRIENLGLLRLSSDRGRDE